MDTLEGQVFAKLSREMIVATGSGLPDPAANFRLRTATDADWGRKVLRLLEVLEDLDNVQAVSANFEMDEPLWAGYEQLS